MANNAETIPGVQLRFEIWDGGNLDAIQALAGAGAVQLSGDCLQIRVAGGRWVDVFPGWAVHAGAGDQVVTVSTPQVWRRFFRPSA